MTTVNNWKVNEAILEAILEVFNIQTWKYSIELLL